MTRRPAVLVADRLATAERLLADPAVSGQRRTDIEASVARLTRELDGRQVGVPCARCGAPLHHPLSVAAGIGPCCQRKQAAA